MGYETKFFFVERHSRLGKEKTDYCSIIAMVDMCKIGEASTAGLVTPEKPEVFIYSLSGKKITKDLYDAPLSIGDPAVVLEKCIEHYRFAKYRRNAAAIALLKVLMRGKYHNLTVLGYGH
jgi:hypothetical protein